MNKNGDDKKATNAPHPVRFDRSFTPMVEEFIEKCKKEERRPTVKEFANNLGVDQHVVWAWASKKKKDDHGNLTEQLARPLFNAALTRLNELEKEHDKKLTPKQELFCQLYASDKEFFGNGVQSYIEAYEIDLSKRGAYKSAASSAYNLLINTDILKRIDQLLEVNGLNDQAVDKELAFVIMQKADLSAKTAAIREYNKLKARVINKHDHTTNGKDLPTPIYGGKSTK